MVDALQHLLPVAQQHGSEIAHRQPRLQHVFRHQTQTAFGLSREHRLGGQRGTRLQRGPGLLQVTGETA
ncbi:hypothetical protein D3C71_1874410 [compost metagenome]